VGQSALVTQGWVQIWSMTVLPEEFSRQSPLAQVFWAEQSAPVALGPNGGAQVKRSRLPPVSVLKTQVVPAAVQSASRLQPGAHASSGGVPLNMSTHTSPGVAAQSASVLQIEVQLRSQAGQRPEAQVAPPVHVTPSAAPPAIASRQKASGLPATSWMSLHSSPDGQLDGPVQGLTTQTSKAPLRPPTVIVCDWQMPAWEHWRFDVQGPEQ
jgi:hypothetical protein